MKRNRKNEKGQGVLEYISTVSFIAVAAIVALMLLAALLEKALAGPACQGGDCNTKWSAFYAAPQGAGVVNK